MRQTYGKWFNQLWRDAVKAGAPEGLQVLPMATNKGQNELVDAYRMEKDAQDAQGKSGGSRRAAFAEYAGTTESDIGKAVASKTQNFAATLNAEDPAMTRALQEAVEKVALRAMKVNGLGIDAAVKYGVKQIYGENYAVHGGVHIPRQLWEGPHGGELSVGLAHADEIIKQEAANIIPRDIIATKIERTADEKKQDYIDDLVNHYKLQTTGDDKGVHVLNSFGRRVYTKDEQPLVIPWERLIGQGQAHPVRSWINQQF